MSCRLVLNGDFTVIDSQQRHLEQQARRLGFADLRASLQAMLEGGWSILQLATHLATTQQAIRRAITDFQVRQQLARQRQHAAHQRHRPRRRARLPQRPCLPGEPTGHPRVDIGAGGG
jgi:hypothetical protein